MKEILTDSVVVTSIRVRRRAYAAGTWLVSKGDTLELDKVSDTIWLLCDGRRCLREIITEIAGRFAWPLDRAIAAVAALLIILEGRGWITFTTSPVQ